MSPVEVDPIDLFAHAPKTSPGRRRRRFWIWAALAILAVPAWVTTDTFFRIYQRRTFLANEAALAKAHGLVIQEGPEKPPPFFTFPLVGENGYGRIELFVAANSLDELLKHPDFDKTLDIQNLFPEADVAVIRNIETGRVISTQTMTHH